MINLTIKSRWDARWVELAEDADAHMARVIRQDELVLRMRSALDPEIEQTWADLGRALVRASELWRLSEDGLERAQALKDEAVQVWTRLDRQAALSVVLGQRALVLMGSGQLDAARGALSQAREVAEAAQALTRYQDSFIEIEALIDAASGDLGQALTRLDELLSRVTHPVLHERTSRLRAQLLASMVR